MDALKGALRLAYRNCSREQLESLSATVGISGTSDKEGVTDWLTHSEFRAIILEVLEEQTRGLYRVGTELENDVTCVLLQHKLNYISSTDAVAVLTRIYAKNTENGR